MSFLYRTLTLVPFQNFHRWREEIKGYIIIRFVRFINFFFYSKFEWSLCNRQTTILTCRKRPSCKRYSDLVCSFVQNILFTFWTKSPWRNFVFLFWRYVSEQVECEWKVERGFGTDDTDPTAKDLCSTTGRVNRLAGDHQRRRGNPFPMSSVQSFT